MKPLLSVSRNEARLRTLALYKAWQRQVPFICEEYDIPPTQKMVRDKVKEKFLVNANAKDTRVIDMLVVKVKIRNTVFIHIEADLLLFWIQISPGFY